MGHRPVHALLLPPGPALLEAVRRALDGGPAVLPLSPDLPRPALDAALAALRPTHLVTPDGVRLLPGGVPSDAAVIIATSGSTGTPKGVELPAGALTASARASLRRIGARPGERWLCCLPTSHISGMQVLVRSLLSGTDPVIHPRFSPEEAAASGAEHVSLVPTQLRRMIDAGVDLGRFRTILLGGAAALPGLLDEARRAGARVVVTYGMSETAGGCVYDGLPLDGVEVKAGGDGRIRIRGPVLFTGYRLREERPFEDGWFVTSDLGVIEDGRLTVLGRADDVIITGGEKVVASAVARVLAEHPGVRDVAVVGRPDPEWGEVVVAVVAGEVTRDGLRAFAKERLPAYAAPKVVEVVPEIPLLPNGKPDLVALRNGSGAFQGNGGGSA
ncbi:AMP-binding protein [Thermobispora bispora]|uniref:AMP-binding protein n=1 Tax=Thermobispora bispora TaxID=2006 RepID=UPI001AF1E6AA|nr:AMP-binding protein [Thermobispora bispora]QSI49763.1 AMP-dependent synthetase [Thermobispora bispora]